MEPDFHQLAALFPNIAAQMRGELSNLHMAAMQLAPNEAREQDPALDVRAALLDQSYYQLLRLVGELTAAASLQSDKPLALQNRDVVELVGELCDRAESLARLVKLKLRFSCAMGSYICAVAPVELEQLLYHLLSNAFKFTPPGGVITVELKRAGGQVLLTVADTGCGMSEERKERLFGAYLEKDRRDAPPHGLGIGVALCRRIAEGHGGRLFAESEEGRGSRFTLSIPDRRCDGDSLSDVGFDYAGGFNHTLLALADALPAEAFLRRNQD